MQSYVTCIIFKFENSEVVWKFRKMTKYLEIIIIKIEIKNFIFGDLIENSDIQKNDLVWKIIIILKLNDNIIFINLDKQLSIHKLK